MSDASPRDEYAVLAGHVRPAGEPRTGEEVWRVERDGHVMSAEVRDDSPFGARLDVLIRLDGDLLFSRRCPDEPLARFAVQALLQDHLRAGWTVQER